MIGIVVGTRPEMMKMAPVIWELERRHVPFKLIHTGQHYDYLMSKIFFEELNFREPDVFLGVGSGSPEQQLARVISSVGGVIEKEKLSVVCVQGDTNTVSGSALAAKAHGCSVVHVESGARSFDRTMPEEINRIVTDHISDLLFAPTKTFVKNLKNEGITKNVVLSGNTEVETLHHMLAKENAPSFANKIPETFALATTHRQANMTEDKMRALWRLFGSLDMPIIFLIHPRTEKLINEKKLTDEVPANVVLEKPVGYFELLWLLKRASLVLTDSGGLQVEATILQKPVGILRTETEWVEIVERKAGVLLGLDGKSPKKLSSFLKSFSPKKDVFKGDAGKLIVSKLLQFTEGHGL